MNNKWYIQLLSVPLTSLLLLGQTTTHAVKIGGENIDLYACIESYALLIDFGQDSRGEYAKKIFPKKYTGAGLCAGIRPFSYLGFEASYLQNSHKYSEGVSLAGYSATGNSEARFRLYTISTVGYLPIPFTLKQLEMVGLFGYSRISYDVEVIGNLSGPNDLYEEIGRGSMSDSKSGITFGLGFQYKPQWKPFSARIMYTRFTIKNGRKHREPSEGLFIRVSYHFK